MKSCLWDAYRELLIKCYLLYTLFKGLIEAVLRRFRGVKPLTPYPTPKNL